MTENDLVDWADLSALGILALRWNSRCPVVDALEFVDNYGDGRRDHDRIARQLRLLEFEAGGRADLSAAELAFDAIAVACGCPQWDYPGQLVRDVQALVAERDAQAAELVVLREQVSQVTLMVLSGERMQKLRELLEVLRRDVREVPQGGEDWEKLCDAEAALAEAFEIPLPG